MSKRIIALLLAAVMVLGLAACGQKTTTTEPATTTPTETTTTTTTTTSTETATTTEPAKDEKYGGDLIYVNNLVSNTMDPHFCQYMTANYNWMQNVWEAPLCHSDTGEIYPLICDYDLSDDGMVLTLTVREYYFSNGQQVTAEDVDASLARFASVNESFGRKTWDYLADKKIEGNTITYTFSQLMPTLLWTLSDLQGCYITTKDICEKYGTEQIMDMADLIGTGPYTLKEYTPDIKVVVERNENYVPTMNDATGPAAPRMAYPDTITYAVNKDEASRTAGMIAGDYHIGNIMSSMREYASQIGLKLNLLSNQWTHGIKFNLAEENSDSPIADVNVRKAIRAALDCKAAMIAVIQADDPERYILDPNPMVAANTTYYNTIIADNEWNICDKELAKKYLAESSYNGEEIIWTCSGGNAYERIATVEIPLLEEIGLNITLNVVDSGSVGALRKDPNNLWDIFYFESQKAVYNPAGYSQITPTSYGFWTSEAHDAAYKVLSTTPTGSAESVQAYKDLCQLIVDECPSVAFGHNVSSFYSQPNVYWNYTGIEQYTWNAYFQD